MPNQPTPNFLDLHPEYDYKYLWRQLLKDFKQSNLQHLTYLTGQSFLQEKKKWCLIRRSSQDSDFEKTWWLINIFNIIFDYQNTILVRGCDEPVYLAAANHQPAKIIFAHGYFSSALHEISHWCIAGKKRRKLDDFGYWYCPDGRNATIQAKFEQVEIKPQAIECLLSLASVQKFYPSADNLDATFDTSKSPFSHNVYQQALDYLQHPNTMPNDAKLLIVIFLMAGGYF